MTIFKMVEFETNYISEFHYLGVGLLVIVIVKVSGVWEGVCVCWGLGDGLVWFKILGLVDLDTCNVCIQPS